MRLRLNTILRAALIAAITAVGFTLTQAQASTEYNGVTYSGYIYNIATGESASFHNRKFSNFYSIDGGTTWQTSTEFAGDGTSYYNGTEPKTTTDGKPFWRFTFGDGEGKYSTLRLTGATANVYLESQFSPFNLGGLIAEAGDATYIVGRKEKECAITLQASTGASANMSIGADTILSVGTAASKNGNVFTVASGGTWTVATGKTLSIGQHNGSTLGNAGIINFNSGANVTMNGGGTIDLSHTNALNVNSLLTIGENTTVKFANNTTLAGTITNNGTVTFAGGTVTLTNSLSGFESSGKYVDWQDQEAENGYVGAMDYTIIKGTSSLTQVIWRDETKDLTNGVLHVDREVDKTTYHMNKSGATLDLAEEIGHNSALTTVEVKGETGTITVNSNSTLGSLSIATNSTATVNGTANLTLNGLTGTGALVKDGNAKLTLGAQLNATNTTSITVNAGELAITQKTAGDTFHNITVAQGATVSVAGAGNSDYRLRYTLDGGTLAYTGSTTGGSVQNDQITLTKDSYISGTGNFYMLAGTFGVTNLILNNHKLIKQDNNTVTLYNTHVGEGTIEVQGGMIDFSSAHNDPEVSADIILNGGAIAGTLNMMKNLSLTAAVNTTLSSGVTVKGSGKTLSVSVGEMKTLTFGGGLTVSSGTAEIAGTVNVNSKSLDLSSSGNSTGKVKVDTEGVLNVNNGMWMGKNSSGIELAEDGVLNIANLNIVGKAQGGSVTTSANNEEYGVGKAAFIIDNATVTATGNVTIGNTLSNVDVVTDAYAVTVGNAENTIAGATVGEGGSFTMTGGTLDNGVTSAGGTVTLTNVKLGTGYTEQGGEETQIAITDTTNYYMGTTDKYLTVVTGDGAASATGSSLSWGDRSNLSMANGQVITTAGSADYGTLYVAEDTNATQIAAYENYELLDTIVVNNWVGLTVNESLSGKTIHVAENAFVTGSALTPQSVEMANGATTYFGSEVTTESGIVFSDAITVSMTNTNKEGDSVKYSTAEKAIEVSADKMMMTGTADVTVSNQLVVDEIVNTTTKVLTLDNVTDTLALVNMDITGSTAKVGYINGEDQQFTEATVSISGVLHGGEATLLANLTLVGGADSMLDVNGGGLQALTLGSLLTVDNANGLVNLDAETLQAISGLNEGGYVTLVKGLDGTSFSTNLQNGDWASTHFNLDGVSEGNYQVFVGDNSMGIMKTSAVPEPTTGTLSLLALAALAARRRRK